MTVHGVCLGRSGAPSFGATLPGITIVRRKAGFYETGTGFGLYGSNFMVRAMICVMKPPFDPTTHNLWRTPSSTGWSILAAPAQGSPVFRLFDTVATNHQVVGFTSDWPQLTIFVYTYDGTTLRLYKNGVLFTTSTSPNINPAPPTNTMQLLSGSDSSWIAHFLGSDGAGAFLDATGVLNWSRSASSKMIMRQNIVPWTSCEQWWNAADVTRLSWTDRISSVVAPVSAVSNNLFFKQLPTSSVPRI